MEVEKINLETKFYQDKKILKIISLGFSHDNQKFLTKILEFFKILLGKPHEYFFKIFWTLVKFGF